ncbi:MAG: alpha/beta hydrolase [Rhodococcus fascians]
MTTSDLLHPDIAKTIEAIPFPTISVDTLPLMRGFEMPRPPLSDAVVRTDVIISEDPLLVVRVHRPTDVSGALPCLFSIHGGGYVLGTNAMDDARFDRWCPMYRCVGVSVDYRLAPETTFPGPLEDCYAGLRWTHENADQFGIDPSRIGIGGVSAGGGLAAALALLARDRAEVAVAFQLLECPMLDDRQATPSSRMDDLAIWSRDSNTFGWQSYLGSLYGSDEVPGYAAPAHAMDLVGLPPAFVAVGTVDGFRDEDIAYATRLNQAMVPTELHVYPGVPHGHELFPQVAPVVQWQRDVEDWLGRQLA